MARNKLTATQVKSLSKPGKHGDGEGLYLQISKAGRKSWVFVFIRSGRRREMGLGPLEGVSSVSLAQARVKADEVRSILGRGGDPFNEMEERAARRPIMKFGTVSDQLIKTLEAEWKNDKHRAQWRMTMDVYAKPLRNLPVAEITVDDVLKVLRPIWSEKRETARRVRARIEKVLDHAKARELRDGENPARWKGNLSEILPAGRQLKRGHHAALPYVEANSLIERIRQFEGTGARALEFTILTAARTSEVLGSKWHEIDFENAIWTVPVQRMKAGKEHRVPLSQAAVQVLAFQSENRMSDFIFPGRSGDRPMSNMTMTKVLRSLDHGHVTVHGFRSTFRDWAGEETTFEREVAEQALAHTIGNAVEQAYRRGDALEKRRRLMEAWSSYLSPAVDGVVKLHG